VTSKSSSQLAIRRVNAVVRAHDDTGHRLPHPDRPPLRLPAPSITDFEMASFFRNLVLQPALRRPIVPTATSIPAPAFSSPIAAAAIRSFSSTPVQSATLNQVLRVRPART